MGQIYAAPTTELIIVGKLGAAFGVRGWLKVCSYTVPKANIWEYKHWFLSGKGTDPAAVCRLKESRSKFLVLLESSCNRDDAHKLTNKHILVARESFPKLGENQYYWVDLIGFKVYNLTNDLLGKLNYVFGNGANDVMVIKSEIEQGIKGYKEYLVPYVLEKVVHKVDMINKLILVDWNCD